VPPPLLAVPPPLLVVPPPLPVVPPPLLAVPPPEPLDTHAPPVHDSPGMQPAHVTPLAPHASGLVPATHLPLESQQPLQFAAVQSTTAGLQDTPNASIATAAIAGTCLKTVRIGGAFGYCG
jgi:hypothetical protein